MSPTAEALIVGLLGHRTAAVVRRVEHGRRRKPHKFDWAYVSLVAEESGADPAVLRRLYRFYERPRDGGEFRGYHRVPAPTPEDFADDDPDQLVAVAISKWME